MQILINSQGLNMNPLQSLYYVSPACLLGLTVPFCAFHTTSADQSCMQRLTPCKWCRCVMEIDEYDSIIQCCMASFLRKWMTDRLFLQWWWSSGRCCGMRQ